MRERPCKCDRFRLGEPFDVSRDCSLCWLFAHSLKYRLHWGGGANVLPVNPTPPAAVRQVSVMPGILQKAKNFAGAVVQHVKAGLPRVTDEQHAARMALCVVCPEYTARGACLKCGCNIAAKARWAEQKCPLGKWEATDAVAQ